MPGATPVDISSAGKRLRQNVVLALVLSSALPLLVLVFVVQQYVLPVLDVADRRSVVGVQALLFFTLIGALIGAFIIWNMGRTMTSIAELLSKDRQTLRLEPRSGQTGTLVANFTRVFDTIEQQATEINSFATRLDAAYKELESTNSKLKETSFKDDVTGLYNRRFFSIRLEEEISRYRRFNHPVSIVLLDLDGFKQVNDELGHAAGDETLREVARILGRHSRGINVCSRYGGDEFVVLLVETGKAGARLYAERIRDVISKFRFTHGKPITASLGIAGLPDDDVSTAEDLFKMADEALYAAKRAGKNQVAVLDPAPDRKG